MDSESGSSSTNPPAQSHKFKLPSWLKKQSSTYRKTNNAPRGASAIQIDVPQRVGAVQEQPKPSAKSETGLISTTVESLCPISELWNQAFDELKQTDEVLIKDYQNALLGDLATGIGSTVIFSGSKVQRQEEMRSLLAKKTLEVKNDTWKLKFGGTGQGVPAKDLAKSVVSVIKWLDDYISGALSANTYASLAWVGVSLLLPLALNPSQQAASLAKGLEYIADLIVRCTMRQNLYEHRYQSKGKAQEGFLSSHVRYRDTLKALYVQILKFQAISISYLSKHGAFRIGLDMIKWDDWDSSLGDVQRREAAFQSVCDIFNDVWKDTIYEKNSEALFAQHQESIHVEKMISSDLSGLKKAVENALADKKRRKLLEWLSDVDPSENFRNAIEKHEANTGNWLLRENEDFKKWKRDSHSLLWLNGKAGSGKSVLSASVIKDLRENDEDGHPQNALAFFYFSFADAKKQNTVQMLSSLVKQLCCHRPDTPSSVESLRAYQEKGQRPDRETLEDTLLATMRGFSNVYVVIDALDESPSSGERATLLRTICKINSQGPDSLHLLLTSRREVDIEAVLSPLISTPGSSTTYDIDLSHIQREVKRDIGVYIDQTFQTSEFRLWPHEIKEEARSELIKNSDGMFQYVACQFDELRRHRSPANIRKALRDLPEGLDDTYDRILKGVDSKYRKQVASVLKWLAFSFRPLFVEELAEIFLLDPEEPVPFDEENRFFEPEDVLIYLPGLVTKFLRLSQITPASETGKRLPR